MRLVNLDLDVLRTFVAGMELGSFARASARLGRSTSAVSAQMKKLEEQVGVAVFRKEGRGLGLTDAGETVLGYARRLLELNDEAIAAVRGSELEGWIRLGLQEDFGETLLPDVLGRFARAHPRVRIEARVARNRELLERVASGQLDLALAWHEGDAFPQVEPLLRLPMSWIGRRAEEGPQWQPGCGEPLPLALLEAPCLLRTAATEALDRAGIAWRVAFVSPSLAGLWAATAAGLGITVRTPLGLPAQLRCLDPAPYGLPPLRQLGLALYRGGSELDPPVERLAAIIRDAVLSGDPVQSNTA